MNLMLLQTPKNMQRFIQLACGDESMPISHLVPFQRLGWSVQEGAGSLSPVFLLQLSD